MWEMHAFYGWSGIVCGHTPPRRFAGTQHAEYPARDVTIYDTYNPILSSTANGSSNNLCGGSAVLSVTASWASVLAENVFVSQVETAAACNSTAMKKGSSPCIVSKNEPIVALPPFCVKDPDLSN
jgi:hypothetical protein